MTVDDENWIVVLLAPEPETALADWFSRVAEWDGAVLPAYGGGSNVNLVGSVLQALEAPAAGGDAGQLPPVAPEILNPDLLAGARVIVLIVLDGLGFLRLRRAVESGEVSGLPSAQFEGSLTSVFPPTTAAALTSLQTGVGPGQHGLAGYTLHLPRQKHVYNMITWKPVGGGRSARSAPDPKTFLPVPSIYSILKEHGIGTALVSNNAFADSALTNVHAAGVTYRGHRTLAEFPELLMREVQRPGRRFVFGYWDGFDVLAHTYGPESRACATELELIDRALGRGFLGPLAKLDDDIAVVVTADHGQTAMPLEGRHNLQDIRGLPKRWRHRPTGEPRLLGLALRNQEDRDRIRDLVNGDGVVLDARQAMNSGLYGPAPLHPELERRVGDTLLLARENTAFTFPGLNNQSLGGHGSLTIGEMLVPLLIWRFRR